MADSEHCQEQFIAARCNAAGAHYDSDQMPARPKFLPDFAKFLVDAREAHGWKQAQAADIAVRRRLQVGYQSLRWLEEGKIKNPEPELIQAVAKLYGLPYEGVLARLLSERYKLVIDESDLLRHSMDQQSGHQEGRPDVPASATARILELESELREFKTKWSDVQDVARRLFSIAVTGDQGAAAPKTQAGRRRTTRKVS